MVAGWSAALLKSFLDGVLETECRKTPYQILEEILAGERYDEVVKVCASVGEDAAAASVDSWPYLRETCFVELTPPSISECPPRPPNDDSGGCVSGSR